MSFLIYKTIFKIKHLNYAHHLHPHLNPQSHYLTLLSNVQKLQGKRVKKSLILYVAVSFYNSP